MVTRMEFCLGRFLPLFPGGLWMASQHHPKTGGPPERNFGVLSWAFFPDF